MTINARFRAPRLLRRRSWTPRRVRLTAALSAISLGLGVIVAAGPAAVAPSVDSIGALSAAAATRTARVTTAYDRTSARERKRVDRVPTPKLRWRSCYGTFSCATVSLPLDYDHPKGAKTKVALLRVKARTKHKTGTLFVNPGGPGGSGTDLASAAPDFLSRSVLDRFDVVGFDPRGVGASSNVHCFSSAAAKARALAPTRDIQFPTDAATAQKTYARMRAFAKGCARTGKPLSASMSTAEVARDLDVLRRAVGDARLSYLGFSYGTYLGQVYANMFPDRTRALVLDGVVDPVAWQGSAATRNDPGWDRIRSAEGTKRAMDELLRRCAAAGPARCSFAAFGNPVTGFDVLARRVLAHPVRVSDGSESYVYGYDELIADVTQDLYDVVGAEEVDGLLSDLWQLSDPATSTSSYLRAARSLDRARRTLAQRRESGRFRASGYDSSDDAFTSVVCTDSPLMDHLSDLTAVAARAAARVRYFGASWVWNGTGCAKDTFAAHDEDAYRGTFTHRTRARLLFVGGAYDPATSLTAATRAAGIARNSALVSNTSWGHTSYGTSACVTGTVDRYLLTGRAPSAKITRCQADYQPFVTQAVSQERATLSAVLAPAAGAPAGR